MKFSLLIRFAAGVVAVMLLGLFVFGANPVLPANFLPAEGRLHQVLESPVSGAFKDRDPQEVVTELCRQLHVNMTYSRDGEGNKKPASKFTGNFQQTPLRTALFQITERAGIKVELHDDGNGYRYLVFHE